MIQQRIQIISQGKIGGNRSKSIATAQHSRGAGRGLRQAPRRLRFRVRRNLHPRRDMANSGVGEGPTFGNHGLSTVPVEDLAFRARAARPNCAFRSFAQMWVA